MLKGGIKAISKAALFMYLSVFFKFMGDKRTLYLGKSNIIKDLVMVGLIFYKPIMKKLGGAAKKDEKAEDIKD
jgi:hypothetical protein